MGREFRVRRERGAYKKRGRGRGEAAKKGRNCLPGGELAVAAAESGAARELINICLISSS